MTARAVVLGLADVVSWYVALAALPLSALTWSPLPLLAAAAFCLAAGLAGAVTPLVNCLVLAHAERLVTRRGRVRADGFRWVLDLGGGRAAVWTPRRGSRWGWHRVVVAA